MTRKSYEYSREKTATTPFLEIKEDGYIKIIGNSTSTEVHKIYSSLFWGINKITSGRAMITIGFGEINNESVNYVKRFFNILQNQQELIDINVIWLYDTQDSHLYKLGSMLKDQYPYMSFQLIQT